MTTTTQIAKGKVSMENTQMITMNGETVSVTPAQVARAAKNSNLLKSRIKTGRGAPQHTYADLVEAIKADYSALKEQGLAALERKFNMGRNLLALRAMFTSDKAFGKAVQSFGLDVISRQDRNDLMWLATNERIVHETLKASDADLASFGMSALRKRAKAHADKTGQETKAVTNRDTSKKSKAKVPAKTSKKSEAKTDGSSDTKTPAKQEPVTAESLASQLFEQGIEANIDPKDLVSAVMAAYQEIILG